MKIKIAAIACLLALIGAWVYIHAQTVPPSGGTALSSEALPTGATGRYQVIAADVDAEGMGGTLKHKTAIRIDTQTGRAWSLDEVDNNFYWIPLQEIK